MNQLLKHKLTNIFATSLYFLTVISICVTSVILLKDTYFGAIFVSGSSMNPTLTGGSGADALAPRIDHVTGEYIPGDTVNFGTIDHSSKAKKNIKRYDIVTTYYPDDDYDSNGKLKSNATYKIKRVIALPGETFKIEEGELYVKYGDEFSKIERAHLVDFDGDVRCKDAAERTLGSNEYWVLGDNRNHSKDSGMIKRPVTIDNITGVLVSIDGVAEYFVHYVCRECGHEIDEKDYLFGRITTCDVCGGGIKKGDGDIRNRQFTYPRIV